MSIRPSALCRGNPLKTADQLWSYDRGRIAELPRWLHRYNWHRPNASLKAMTPISRLRLVEDRPLSAYRPATGSGPTVALQRAYCS
jgi:hypothetical protein